MATYILVHGAWHGAWAWQEVAPALEAGGHKVIAASLPGHGDDKTPASEVTMQAYVQHIVELLDRQAHPVVLVGHSMSGAVISQVAEERPEKVAQLVFVAAFLLRSGESVLQAMQSDKHGKLLPHVRFTADQSGGIIDEAAVRDFIYNETPEDRRRLATPRLLPSQPIQPLGVPVRLSEARFGRVPRAYAKCQHDWLLSPAAQEQMLAAWPCDRVFLLEADHVPFFSKPAELSAALLSLAPEKD
ncbi:alpha/beta fold hydrolase [candidate division KSB1 bacterium]|nr:MAG: alpha/beta fold hydrolase [candidate division KSB1 bacterium]MCE7942470.1 alpha/beta fold hydrolase [Chlorobi bacterium CHB1]MDL1877190.1 alpha/beta fold hydrolase [Cytophagia bacterium CHB2]